MFIHFPLVRSTLRLYNLSCAGMKNVALACSDRLSNSDLRQMTKVEACRRGPVAQRQLSQIQASGNAAQANDQQ